MPARLRLAVNNFRVPEIAIIAVLRSGSPVASGIDWKSLLSLARLSKGDGTLPIGFVRQELRFVEFFFFLSFRLAFPFQTAPAAHYKP